MRVTLGSLFDGIGVFPLAASLAGITPLWASEIERHPISITKRHFPHMKHLGDLTKLHGGSIPPVDIITFGSPCQNLSTGGNREGLGGKQSSLFHEAIRLIEEMREETHGKYPTFAVWENVTGAFLSNDRLDFAAVLQSFTHAKIPLPATPWADSGMVTGGYSSLCWRALDAQYFGLPHRRRRVFLVADFTGNRGPDILFKPRPLHTTYEGGSHRRLWCSPLLRANSKETGWEVPQVFPLQERKIRQCATGRSKREFLRGFGRSTDPLPTLTTGVPDPITLIYSQSPERNHARVLTPIECERAMGLPDDWTKYGYENEVIADTPRYFAIGNSIAVPCARYVMDGVSAVLQKGSEHHKPKKI